MGSIWQYGIIKENAPVEIGSLFGGHLFFESFYSVEFLEKVLTGCCSHWIDDAPAGEASYAVGR